MTHTPSSFFFSTSQICHRVMQLCGLEVKFFFLSIFRLFWGGGGGVVVVTMVQTQVFCVSEQNM